MEDITATSTEPVPVHPSTPHTDDIPEQSQDAGVGTDHGHDHEHNHGHERYSPEDFLIGDFDKDGFHAEMTLEDFMGACPPPRGAQHRMVTPSDTEVNSSAGSPVLADHLTPPDTAAAPSTGVPLATPSEERVTGFNTVLPDLVRELMAVDDPSHIIIKVEVRSFFSFISTMVDALLGGGVSLHQFRPFIDPQVASIRNAGYPELAQAIVDDLGQLEAKLRRLEELETAGVSSYLASRVEDRVKAWRNARVFASFEVQMLRDEAHHLEIATAEASSSLGHLQSCVDISRGKIAQLEQILHAERENLAALESKQAAEGAALALVSAKFDLSRQKLFAIEEETARTLSTSENSFRAELQEELQRNFFDEVAGLKQEICYHKLNV